MSGVNIHLVSTLNYADTVYGDDELYKLMGPTLLTWNNTDSARLNMVNSHIKQSLTILDPDFPRYSTGMENTVGKFNHAYLKLEGVWKIVDIIPKFKFPKELSDTTDINKIQIVTIVLYNKKLNMYDVYEKEVAQNLTEKFGYLYNNSFIESLKIGDVFKDPILTKSTSYDEYMNYRYGKNALVYYSASTDTNEDALVVRKGFADKIKTPEVDLIQIPINDNDVLLNLYGDDDNYKPFPEVGQKVKESMLCATRRINKSHLLFDFKKEKMRELGDIDNIYYTSKDSEIYDINVYYNGEEKFPENKFYSQLKRYYDDNCEYYQKVHETCYDIIYNSGASYTDNVSHFEFKCCHWNDPEYQWKNKDKVFNNIIVEFKVKSEISLENGSKIAGRCGNKGVVSKILDAGNDISVKDAIIDLVDDGNMSIEEREKMAYSINLEDDERMPYYIKPDGTRVYADIIMNASGAIRRLNPIQLIETEVNFIGSQVQELVKQAPTTQEKLKLIFKFLSACNDAEGKFFKEMYDSYDVVKEVNGLRIKFKSPDSKKAFIKDIEENGFYIRTPPHKPLLFKDVCHLYDIFPTIKPVDIYYDIFGLKQQKAIIPGIIGYQYIIVLKQNSNKNYSSRSMGSTNKADIPAKDNAKKTNRASYSTTPVKISEIFNLASSVPVSALAEHNLVTRSSPIGRKSLRRILEATGNPAAIQSIKIRDNFTNVNAQILAAKLKSMGIKINFHMVPPEEQEIYSRYVTREMNFGQYTVMDTYDKRPIYNDLFERFNNKMKEFLYIETYPGEKSDIVWDDIFKNTDVVKEYDLSEEFITNIKNVTKFKIVSIYNLVKQNNAKNKYTSNIEVKEDKPHRGRKRKVNK